MSADDDPLELAWQALDGGRPEEALERVAARGTDDPRARLVQGLARLDLGQLAPAREALDAAARDLDPAQADLAAGRAELELLEWRIPAARRAFQALVARDPSAWALDRLALCLELEGDSAGAERCFARAARLDPEGHPVPPRLDDPDFDALVEEAVSDLPQRYRSALARARLVTEPLPFAALVPRGDPAATPPDLLGLFTGPTLHELAEDASAELPPTIYLFQRNLERVARDRAQLVLEIRTTLFHELGHLLGLDEDEVDALGLA